jgi:predicted MFS family arabinose efflux permease
MIASAAIQAAFNVGTSLGAFGGLLQRLNYAGLNLVGKCGHGAECANYSILFKKKT